MRYIARQAILDTESNCYGYELLYRNGYEASAHIVDWDRVLKETIDNVFLLGVESLRRSRKLFVNCTRDVLVNQSLTLFPPQSTVLEILETIEPDADVLRACGQLKAQGYTLALDDFVDNDLTRPLLDYAAIIKIDVQATSPACQIDLARSLGGNFRLLAERVETRAEYDASKELGFTLFQGYFFYRPEVVEVRDVSALNVRYTQLLDVVNRPEIDLRRAEEIVKCDPALCYRLLRYLNSAAFGFRCSINSIRHAFALLGDRELRKWVSLAAVSVLSKGKAEELLTSALLRARFLELLAPKAKCKPYNAFLVGLLSLVDGMVGMPLAKFVDQLLLPADTRCALLGRPCRLEKLAALAFAYEKADWSRCQALASELGTSESAITECYWNAVNWTQMLSV
ncbi:MAG: HDOD domain-containing protein [Acidobacteriia bacterium]|nr:HDOD domain-containing protein [Terriglobia bacterium]